MADMPHVKKTQQGNEVKTITLDEMKAEQAKALRHVERMTEISKQLTQAREKKRATWHDFDKGTDAWLTRRVCIEEEIKTLEIEFNAGHSKVQEILKETMEKEVVA